MKTKNCVRNLLLVATAILFLNSAYSQSANEQAVALLANGKAEADKSKRIEIYTACINMNQRIPEANCKRGIDYYSLGRYNEAVTDFETAIGMIPLYHEAILYLGLSRYKLGKYAEAIHTLDIANTVKPEYAYGYYYKGLAEYDLGQTDPAIKDFLKTISLKPSYEEAYVGLGKSYFISLSPDHDSLAIAAYSKAIELKPLHAEAYYGRATVYFVLVRLGPTLTDLNKAIELKPDYIDAYLLRADTKNQQAGFKGNKGLEDISSALALKSDCGQCYYARMNIFNLNSGLTTTVPKSEQIIADARKMIALNYEPEAAYLALGKQYFSTGKYQEALNNYNEALKLAKYDADNVNSLIEKTKAKMGAKK